MPLCLNCFYPHSHVHLVSWSVFTCIAIHSSSWELRLFVIFMKLTFVFHTFVYHSVSIRVLLIFFLFICRVLKRRARVNKCVQNHCMCCHYFLCCPQKNKLRWVYRMLMYLEGRKIYLDPFEAHEHIVLMIHVCVYFSLLSIGFCSSPWGLQTVCGSDQCGRDITHHS